MNEPHGPRVVLATRNPKKLTELRRILGPQINGIEVLGLSDVTQFDEPAETEATFEGNALIKARACLKATGLPSFADDSGLCIDALNGMPGVLSARWSGEGDDANNALVLQQLADVPAERRTAQFRCVIALCLPDGPEIVEHGVMHGRVLAGLRGDHGFGYDPIFAADGFDVSTAELSAAQKDAVSHRGNALRAIAPQAVGALSENRSVT